MQRCSDGAPIASLTHVLHTGLHLYGLPVRVLKKEKRNKSTWTCVRCRKGGRHQNGRSCCGFAAGSLSLAGSHPTESDGRRGSVSGTTNPVNHAAREGELHIVDKLGPRALDKGVLTVQRSCGRAPPSFKPAVLLISVSSCCTMMLVPTGARVNISLVKLPH